MQKASAAGRKLIWFPEGSWWLSYDNPIPVYLTLYIATRANTEKTFKEFLEDNGPILKQLVQPWKWGS